MAFWDPDVELELDEGEEQLYIIRRHWLLLLRDAIVPLVIAIGAGAMAFYRAIGGAFLSSATGAGGDFDTFSIALLAIVAVLIFFWQRSDSKKSKNKSKYFEAEWLYLIGAGMLLLLIWFRYQGGQLLYIDPLNARPADLINTLLIILAFLMILYVLYVAIDWRDNALILTNARVVYDDEQFLVRHIQQQILISDIQQVSRRQNTYPAVLFGYGTIIVQAFSQRRIEFTFATDAREMELRIMAEVNKARQRQAPNLLRTMLESKVYNVSQSPQPIKTYLHVEGESRGGLVRWLFPLNPEINEKNGTIIWRPSSTYIAIQLLRPVGTLLAITAGVIISAQIGLLPGPWMLGIWLIAVLICSAWIFWLREELVNDAYILTRASIIDVDKKPFGPEDRRSAGLDRVQNVAFDISFIESILGYGTVKVQTGGSGDFSFNHVPEPRMVQATINDYLTDFKRSAQERALQDAVALLKEYHGLQLDRGELFDPQSMNTAIGEQANAAITRYAAEELPPRVAREVATQIPYHMRRVARQMTHANTGRTTRLRRRRRI